MGKGKEVLAVAADIHHRSPRPRGILQADHILTDHSYLLFVLKSRLGSTEENPDFFVRGLEAIRFKFKESPRTFSEATPELNSISLDGPIHFALQFHENTKRPTDTNEERKKNPSKYTTGKKERKK